jgi:hypothetical protein
LLGGICNSRSAASAARRVATRVRVDWRVATAATDLVTLPDVEAIVPPLPRAPRSATAVSPPVDRPFIVLFTSGCPPETGSAPLRVTPSHCEWLRRMDGVSPVCWRVSRARVPALPLAALPLSVPLWLAATGPTAIGSTATGATATGVTATGAVGRSISGGVAVARGNNG